MAAGVLPHDLWFKAMVNSLALRAKPNPHLSNHFCSLPWLVSPSSDALRGICDIFLLASLRRFVLPGLHGNRAGIFFFLLANDWKSGAINSQQGHYFCSVPSSWI